MSTSQMLRLSFGMLMALVALLGVALILPLRPVEANGDVVSLIVHIAGLVLALVSCGAVGHVAFHRKPTFDSSPQQSKSEHREFREQVVPSLESITDAFIRYDRDWRIVFANAEAERINQLPRAKMLGKTPWELFPAVVGTKLESEFRRALAERITVEFENYFEPWDRWYAIKCYPASDGGLTTFVRDITEQKRAEEAERASERQLRLVTDHAPVMIAHCDVDARYKFVNKPYAARFGLDPPDVIGKRIPEVVGERAYSTFDQRVAEVLAGYPVEFEVEIPYRTGGTQYMQCAYVPERNGEQVVGFVAAIANITERKRAEDDLRQSERRLDLVLRSINDHFVTYDRDWRYTYVNDRAAEILGRPKSELLGKCIWDLFPDAVGNQYYAELHRAFADQQVISSEHFYPPFDAWFENRIYPSPDGVTVFASDITERKRIEEQLLRSAELLRVLID